MKRSQLALIGLALSILLSSLGTSIANVALPTLATAFDAPFQAVKWVVVAYLFALTASSVLAGRLADRLGRRLVLLAGLGAFSLGSLVSGLAPTLGVLVAARAVQGLGAALMMTLSIAAVRDNAPPERAGLAMGLLGSTSAVGTALGPALGGVLIEAFGWRAIFLVSAPFGLLAAALVSLSIDADRPRAEDKPEKLVWSRALASSLVASFLVATVMMSTLVVGPFYVMRSLRLDAGLLGVVMAAGPLVAALTGAPAGRLVDRFGARRATASGLCMIGVGTLALATLAETVGLVGYVLLIAVVTAGYALFQTANNTQVMQGALAGQSGYVAGVLGLSRNLGLIAGAWALSAIFASAMGASDAAIASPEAVAAGTRVTFGVAAALALVGLLLVSRRAATASHRTLRPASP